MPLLLEDCFPTMFEDKMLESMNTKALQIVLMIVSTLALVVKAKSLDPQQGIDNDQALMRHLMASHLSDDVDGLRYKATFGEDPIKWMKPVGDEALHWAGNSKRVGKGRTSLRSHRRNDVYGVAGRFGRSAQFNPITIED